MNKFFGWLFGTPEYCATLSDAEVIVRKHTSGRDCYFAEDALREVQREQRRQADVQIIQPYGSLQAMACQVATYAAHAWKERALAAENKLMVRTADLAICEGSNETLSNDNDLLREERDAALRQLEESREERHATVEALGASNEALREDLAEITTENDNLRSKVSDLRERISELNDEIAELED